MNSGDMLPCANCSASVEVQHQVSQLATTVSELNRTVIDLRILVTDLSAQVKYTACPSPGACVTLANDLKEVSKEVALLKSMSDQRVGERTVIALVSVFAGGLVSTILSWWLNK